MFSTFSANLNSADPAEQPAAAPRPKRNQVVRACDWCRLNRVKCDANPPCQNCRNNGKQCSNTKQLEAHSLPVANREIHRLRIRLKELQEQLDKVTDESNNHAADAQTPQSSNASNYTIAKPAKLPTSHRKTWDGIHDPESRTGRVIHYGPLSSPYMVIRLNEHMSKSSNRPDLKSMLPISISRIHSHSPTASHEQLSEEPERPSLRLALAEVEDLSREQEEYFLVLLWQAYNCIYPIVAQEEFRQYYESLWTGTNGQAPRQPSALVDSLLAVCMQYGSTFLIGDEDMTDAEREAQATRFNTAAHAFYRRSQRALMETIGQASIQSLQSHIYCIIYMYNVANLDTAHALLGLAIRMAHSLRLHIRPLSSTPEPKQELFSRIWWTLYQLDSQISMTLGRPPLINSDEVGCAIPKDRGDAVQLSTAGLISPPDEDITWLSFHVHYVRLTAAARRVHDAFGTRTAEFLQAKDIQDIHDDRVTRESLAGFVGSEVRAMYDWVQTVPRSLKNQRKGSGEAFSTDRTPLNLNPASPLWLQRQRLLLEITYHHLQIANFRPFICFPPRDAAVTPLSDNHSIAALNHAVVLTMIVNQVLSDTDLLNGWTPVFQYQWDATICIISFILANPVCPPTPAARKILPTALRTLQKVGQLFAPAANTIQAAWQHFRSSSTPYGWPMLTPPSQTSSDTVPSTGVAAMKPTSLKPTDLFPQFLTTTETLSNNMAPKNDLPDRAAMTPPLDFMDPSFNLPSDLLMGTDTQWMPNGDLLLNNGMSSDGWV